MSDPGGDQHDLGAEAAEAGHRSVNQQILPWLLAVVPIEN
jgi:hypothetical protein